MIRDIHGIDPVSWWPPAIGWWLLLALALFLLFRLLSWWQNRGDWRSDAKRQLNRLQKRLKGDDRACDEQGCEVLTELSAILRRAAIARFGRRHCAGLTGDAWLEFLSRHDPKGFDWASEGGILTRIPYAPLSGGVQVENAEVRKLILAARAWSTGKGPVGGSPDGEGGD